MARWPETAAGSESTARAEREAPRDLGDPLWSRSALTRIEYAGRYGSFLRKADAAVEVGFAGSTQSAGNRTHGEAAKQMKTDFRETLPAPTEAGGGCQHN